MTDRVMTRWRRPPIPPANIEKAVWVMDVAFPADFLSQDFTKSNDEILWLPSAPKGRSIHIDFLFSADRPEVVKPLMERAARVPIAAFPLENGNWFYVSSYESDFKGQEIRIPQAGKRGFDMVIARRDEMNTGRPIRVLVMSNPIDGEKMVAWEYGAFRADSNVAIYVGGTLSPDRVFHSTWKPFDDGST